MTTRNLRTLLVEAEGELAQVDVPRDVDRRLRARLFERQGARPWALGLLAACGVALALVLFAVLLKPGTRTLDGLEVTSASNDFQAALSSDRVIELSRGKCTLVDAQSGEQISVAAPATLRRDPEGLRVLGGTAELLVQKRVPTGPSIRVLVSHGAIEIVGTRFTVVQEPDRGSVTLHEGEIRFQSASGGSRALAIGERLEWPLAPATKVEPGPEPEPALLPPVVKSKKPLRVAPPAPIVFRDPEDLLQQVDVLRSRGLFPEAARYLTHGLTTPLRPATRERFSYELGSILTYQLGDPGTCRHWQDHSRWYPAGRYQTEVLQASAHARCHGAP